jgi:mono/diheme cytochrome c family protein
MLRTAIALLLALCSSLAGQTIEHAQIIRSLDDAALERGKAIYHSVCFACHGVDGKTPTNPQARSFADAPMLNGSDPFSLWKTLTYGFNTMPAHTFLTPQQRYDSIHYLREAFLKPLNPSQYTPITPEYLAALPITAEAPAPTESDRDFGPVLASQLGGAIQNSLTFRLPHDVTFNYDLHRMRSGGIWTGGFLDLSATHHFQQRGEGMPKPTGTRLPALATWAWAFNGSFNIAPDDKLPRGPVRSDWLTYRGHYLHANTAVVSYAIHDRAILETIGVDHSPQLLVVHHTLRIAPGSQPLQLAVAQQSRPAQAGVVPVGQTSPAPRSGPATAHLAFVTAAAKDRSPENAVHAAAAVVGDTDGLTWEIDADGRVVLHIPASEKPRILRVVRSSGTGPEYLNRFGQYAQFSAGNIKLVDPKDLTRGGPTRWPQQLTVTGTLGQPTNGYALDTIPVPFNNPWRAWLRTSALAFFDDGRAVVTTHGGDVYIVTGINSDLSKVTWRRFAAGLFEPFGVLVVNGIIHVTCRDGIKRLHDIDGNGEADFIEAFQIDPDVSSSFHAFNFDLQIDSKGNLYYAKAGQYTHYDVPGAIIRVNAQGKSDIVAWGIRTPNGMGMLPGDRVLVSDNQGPWMPAGKISVVEPGTGPFLGNMPNDKQQPWVMTHAGKIPDSFIEPIIWMPQELDNSCGGQLWVDDARFGPLGKERLLHSSFGKGWVYYLSMQRIGDTTQASMVALPHQWDAGVMRLRVNPADGQVYGVGLSGWQGPTDGKDGCFQRLRYAGKDHPARIIEQATVIADGVRLDLNFPINPASAGNAANWRAQMWDYRWTGRYGSDQFSVRSPDQKGRDDLRIERVDISADGKQVTLKLPDLAVCDQLLLTMKLKAADGADFAQQVHLTVHAIPQQ